MRFPRLVVCLIFFMSAVGMTSSRENPCANSEQMPCRCERIKNSNGYFEDHVNCSREGLSEIPATLPDFLTVLDVSHNHLLPEKLHTLCKYVNIADVSLAYNYLNELQDGQLSGCYISHSLNLEGNVFNSINSNALLGLEDVKTIYGLEAQRFNHDTFIKFRKLEQLSMKTYQTTISGDLFDSLELKHLSLSVSGALQIPNNLLQFGNTSLKELYIESTSLQRIPNDLLKLLLNVETLSLNMNNIHALPIDLFHFEGHNHLRTLHIAGVRSLPRGVFNDLGHLTRLEIHDMEDFPSKLFKGLMELVHLDLTNCYFGYDSIPQDLFKDLWSLNSLNLSGCSIASLEENSFAGLQSLETLNVSFNSIRYLTGRPFIHVHSTVKEIILKANDISVIESTVLNDLNELITLDLSENNIYSLNENSFTDLIKLEHLMLYRNKMAHLPSGLFRTLTALKTLNLAYNVLDEDPGSLLSSAKDLSVLNLSDNRITKLSVSLVSKLVGLTDLDLEYNPLMCDCELLHVRNVLLARNVHLIAWCSYPTYRSLENAVILDCPEKSSHITQSETFNSMNERLPGSQDKPFNPGESTIHFTERLASQSEDATAYLGTSVYLSSTATCVTQFRAQTATSVNVPLMITDAPISSAATTASGISATLSSEVPSIPVSALIHPQVKPHQEANLIPNDTLSMQTKYYISVGAISFVSFLCVVILICLACRKRQSRMYEISEVFSRGIVLDKFIDSQINATPRADTSMSRNGGLVTLKEVPSIQIDVVDDDGNVNSVMYPATEVPILESQ